VSAFINLKSLDIVFGAIGGSKAQFYADSKAIINCYPNIFTFWPTGTFKLPILVDAPTEHAGDLACNYSNDWFVGYISDWEHFQTTDGW